MVKLDPDADILGHGGISIILAHLIYVSFQIQHRDISNRDIINIILRSKMTMKKDFLMTWKFDFK